MVIGIRNLEWQNHNAQRNYPLAASASARDQSLTFTLPENFLLSLYLPVHAGLDVDSSHFFIKHIGNHPSGYSVIVGYQPAAGDPLNVATAFINRDVHEPGQAYVLGGINSFVDTRGHVVIGALDDIDEQPPGFFQFDFEAGRLEPDAIRPMIRGVSGIRVRNGADVSELLTGIVELVARDNMQILPIVEVGEDPVLQFSAIDGAGTIEECVCEGDDSAVCIRRINGVPPTPAGDFTLLGDDCIELAPIQNGLSIRDACSSPCCGCVELEAVTRNLAEFNSQATTLKTFLERLEGSVNAMDSVVLGSKLNDRGCLAC